MVGLLPGETPNFGKNPGQAVSVMNNRGLFILQTQF